MKRYRKINKKRLTTTKLITIFILSVLFVSVGYSLLSSELSIVGKGTLVLNEDYQDDYLVTYTKETWFSSNQHHYNFNLTLNNNTNHPIYNWKIIIDVPNDVSNVTCWSSSCKVENSKVIISNLEYNGTIHPSASTQLGFNISTSQGQLELNKINVVIPIEEDNQPEIPDLPDPELPSIVEGLEVQIIKENGWMSGANYINQYSITIKNNSNKKFTSWEIALKMGSAEIINAWNTTTLLKDGYLYLSNVSYNGEININNNISFGMQISSPSANFTPTLEYSTGTQEG